MKKSLIVEIIRSLFIFFFLLNALSSVIENQSLRNFFGIMPVTYLNSELFAWLLPISEFIIVALLLFRRTRKAAYYFSVAWVTLLIIYIIRTPGLPHDFGGIFNYLPVPWHQVLMLIVIGLLAITGIVIGSPGKLKTDPVPVVYT